MTETQTPQPFHHGLSHNQVEGIGAVERMLASLLQHIKDETGFKPENRYIDAVKILDRISATNAQLMQMFDRLKLELSQKKEHN